MGPTDGRKGRFGVLISSAGRRVSLVRGFQRALADLGMAGAVVAVDRTPLSSAWHAADRRHLVPACTDPEFIPAVLGVCEQEDVSLVIPTIDTELPYYAKHRDDFANVGISIAVSSPEVVEIGGDKLATNRWLRGAGLPAPRQAPVGGVVADPAGWEFPLIVKPRFGSSSKGVAVIADRQGLEQVSATPDLLVETIAPGAEHTIDVLVDRQGGYVCAVPRRRIEVRAGEISKGVTVRSEPLIALARQATASLNGPSGVLTFQLFADTHGVSTFIEMNPRFGGGFPLSLEAGANYPRWMIEEIAGVPSTASERSWRSGVVMLRYDDAVFVDADKAGLASEPAE